MTDQENRRARNARRRHLTDRLENLRVRTELIETELRQYTDEYFRVCIFGSARIKANDEIYQMTERLAFLLGSAGIDVLTGGGPGLMEAANKGARAGREEGKTKSRSYGISIQIATEKLPNEHLDIKHHHRKFSSRLDDFMRLSEGVVVMPGGIGTVLELFFSWQLLQVKHINARPIILVGTGFWDGLIVWMKKELVGRGLVSDGDFNWLRVVDTPEQAFEILRDEFQQFQQRKLPPAEPPVPE